MWTIPFPIVLATAVPNTNAATKFQKAAHATARNGVSTRVETTVAMEFAASCQPLENSNSKVSPTTASSRLKLFTDTTLSHVISRVGVAIARTIATHIHVINAHY